MPQVSLVDLGPYDCQAIEPQRWNGFLCPVMTKDQLKACLDDMLARGALEGPAVWHPDGSVEAVSQGTDEPDWFAPEAKGQYAGLYRVGSTYAWEEP